MASPRLIAQDEGADGADAAGEESLEEQLTPEQLAEIEGLVAAANAEMEEIESFGWEREGVGKLGRIAQIEIPEGYRFTGKRGTEKLMKLYGNQLTDMELGTLATEDLDWFVVFEFDRIGYVKDDEKDDLDADEMMEAFQTAQEAANEQRRRMGLATMQVTGWAKEPFYNEETNNLEWALALESEGEPFVNYKTKLLGRHGVMDSVLVCDADAMDSILPTYQQLLQGFEYSSGNSYAEYQEGDKIAEYGLKALMVGGGAFAAAKLGLFGVLGKYIGKLWILIVAAVIGLKGFIVRLFTGRKNQYTMD